MQKQIEKYHKCNTYREGEEVVKGVRYDVCVSTDYIEYVEDEVEIQKECQSTFSAL